MLCVTDSASLPPVCVLPPRTAPCAPGLINDVQPIRGRGERCTVGAAPVCNLPRRGEHLPSLSLRLSSEHYPPTTTPVSSASAVQHESRTPQSHRLAIRSVRASDVTVQSDPQFVLLHSPLFHLFLHSPLLSVAKPPPPTPATPTPSRPRSRLYMSLLPRIGGFSSAGGQI